MKNIKPLGKRVLVKRSTSLKTSGGILLPEAAQEKPKEGIIIAVGDGEMSKEGKMIPLTVKVDDKVLFSSYAGTEVKSSSKDDEYLVMSEDDILAILN